MIWERAARTAKSMILAIAARPDLNGCKFFVELHDHCDANMLGDVEEMTKEGEAYRTKDDDPEVSITSWALAVHTCAVQDCGSLFEGDDNDDDRQDKTNRRTGNDLARDGPMGVAQPAAPDAWLLRALPPEVQSRIREKVELFNQTSRNRTIPMGSGTSEPSTMRACGCSGRSTITTRRWSAAAKIRATPARQARVLTIMLREEY